MHLLVSVADAVEARAALLGGADVIDAKDPRDGALGAVRPEVLHALRDAVAGRPLSAALGDRGPPALVERRARAAAQVGAAFVKLGFRGAAAVSQARRRAAAARRGAGARTGLVLVGYADWQRGGGIEPDALLALAVETNAVGVLLDTMVKDAGLFTLLEPEVIGGWVAAAHGTGLFACLAGSLRGADFATSRALGADVVGVRGAACVGGRTGRVSRARVTALSALARSAPLAAAALV
jgi:uncharacterized protein (UPF0264 family)